ncbi:MAG: hypothetical protein QXR03_00870 [Candidatus Aenigmatarchaeota archaeon]
MRKRILVLTIILSILIGFIFSFYYYEIKNLLIEIIFPDEYRKESEKIFHNVLSNIKEVRGLEPPNDSRIEIVTIDWVKENWGKRQVEISLKEIEIKEEIYKALFLISENVSLKETTIKQSGYVLAATSGGVIYIVREYFNPYDLEKAYEILSHEITHIIQGKYFKTPSLKTHDEIQAWSALIEGDAGLTSKKFIERIKENKIGLSLLFFKSYNSKNALDEILFFPYKYGENFVLFLYNLGGWNKVNQAYENIPKSTEQILHPEKYLIYEEPIKVDGIRLNISEWSIAKTETYGEYFLRIMLSNWIGEDLSEKAAEGWGGDNFTFYIRENNVSNYVFFWKIVWDREEDALEFYSCFREMMNKTNSIEIIKDVWKNKNRFLSLKFLKNEVLLIGSNNEEIFKEILKI